MNETTISALQYSKYSMSSQIQIQYVSAKSLKGISFPKKNVLIDGQMTSRNWLP